MTIEGKAKINTGKIEGRKPGMTYSSPVPNKTARSKLDTPGPLPIKSQKEGK